MRSFRITDNLKASTADIFWRCKALWCDRFHHFMPVLQFTFWRNNISVEEESSILIWNCADGLGKWQMPGDTRLFTSQLNRGRRAGWERALRVCGCGPCMVRRNHLMYFLWIHSCNSIRWLSTGSATQLAGPNWKTLGLVKAVLHKNNRNGIAVISNHHYAHYLRYFGLMSLSKVFSVSCCMLTTSSLFSFTVRRWSSSLFILRNGELESEALPHPGPH